MGIRTLYVTGTAGVTGTNWWSLLQDGGTAPTAANTAYGWTVAKTATTSAFWRARLGATAAATVASSTSTIDSTTSPTVGTGAGNTTAGDSFRVGPFIGTFANTNWVFAWNMRAGVAGAIGRVRLRVWKSSNANGSSATALTGSTQVGSTITLSTSADNNSAITWAPGGTIALTSQYLFFQVEWEETTAGTSNTDNVFFRAGTALITTPDFTYSTPYSLPSASAWFDAQDNSKITLTGAQITNWNDSIFGYAASRGSGGSAGLAPDWDVQGVDAFQGILVTNPALVRVLAFPAALLIGTPVTLIAVCKVDFSGGNSTAPIIGAAASGGFEGFVGTTFNGINKQSVTAGPHSTNSALTLSICVWQLTASNYAYRTNGTADGSGASALGAIAPAGSGFMLMNASNQVTAEAWAGYVGDVIICATDLATADIQIAEGYLAWKYNLVQVLPTAHPYKAAPPSGIVPFLVPPRQRTYKRR